MENEFKRVIQEDNHGCVPACVAMILGWDYARAKALFNNDFTVDGVELATGCCAVIDQGWIAVEKIVVTYNQIDDHRDFMLQPFADVHMVSIRHGVDSKTGHAVVMLKDGTILDPSEDPSGKIYYVRHIIGFWKR